jgi:hypothetical protein
MTGPPRIALTHTPRFVVLRVLPTVADAGATCAGGGPAGALLFYDATPRYGIITGAASLIGRQWHPAMIGGNGLSHSRRSPKAVSSRERHLFEAPEYHQSIKNTDEFVWEQIAFQFSEFRELIETTRVETKDEAIGEITSKGWRNTAPRWFDPEVGKKVRAWNLIPYIYGVSQAELYERIEDARALIPILEAAIRERALSLELLGAWGKFCSAVGAVQFVYFQDPHVGHARSAKAGGEAVGTEEHQRWFSHYFLQRYAWGKRKETEAAVEKLILSIIEGGVNLPAGHDVQWFERFLRMDLAPGEPLYAKLRTTYGEHELSIKEMKRLRELGPKGLPLLDLEFPEP